MGKRQRSRESSWGEFHAIQKMLNAAPEVGGQGTFGWEGRLVHSRCNITSRSKPRQDKSWVYGRQWEYDRGWDVTSARAKPRRDRPIRIRGSARALGTSRKHC